VYNPLSKGPLISAVINTFNEEANIADCIQSLRGFADEIVVCDMHSTDQTIALAQKLGARTTLVTAKFGDFGRLRHHAVRHATGQWILVIDADERMTLPLARKLREIAEQNQAKVVNISNLYWYFGGWVYQGDFFRNNWPRFFQRETYLSRFEEQDEAIHNDLSTLSGVTDQMSLPKQYYLKHYAYPTIEKYINKTLGMYARLEGEQYFSRQRHFSLLRMIGEPVKVFLINYFLKQGFRDGMRGFILNVLFAGYRFTIWANVWLLQELAQQKNTGVEPEPKL
jgi:glycosyltransferase involved in cell wall biosynthesis